MAEPFLSEIRIMSFGFAPRGWAQCDGRTLPINQNQALFALLGTTFGGDGRVTFALPDLRGRTSIHVGNRHTWGEAGGEPSHALTTPELPTHLHAFNASQANANGPTPGNAMFGTSNNMYAGAANLTDVNPQTIMSTGGGAAHQNMQPFLTLFFCIALQGIFPSAN